MVEFMRDFDPSENSTVVFKGHLNASSKANEIDAWNQLFKLSGFWLKEYKSNLLEDLMLLENHKLGKRDLSRTYHMCILFRVNEKKTLGRIYEVSTKMVQAL